MTYYLLGWSSILPILMFILCKYATRMVQHLINRNTLLAGIESIDM